MEANSERVELSEGLMCVWTYILGDDGGAAKERKKTAREEWGFPDTRFSPKTEFRDSHHLSESRYRHLMHFKWVLKFLGSKEKLWLKFILEKRKDEREIKYLTMWGYNNLASITTGEVLICVYVCVCDYYHFLKSLQFVSQDNLKDICFRETLQSVPQFFRASLILLIFKSLSFESPFHNFSVQLLKSIHLPATL